MKGYKALQPQYWWDFERGVSVVIIESTHPAYPVVARFTVPKGSLDARPQIEAAEQVIADLESGRLGPKQVAKLHSILPRKVVKRARNHR